MGLLGGLQCFIFSPDVGYMVFLGNVLDCSLVLGTFLYVLSSLKKVEKILLNKTNMIKLSDVGVSKVYV